MLSIGEPSIPENGVISSSSSPLKSPILDPLPPQERHIGRITNNNLSKNRDAFDILEIELLYDETLKRKRLRTHSTDDGEEEDGSATEAVSDANKLHRVHEEQRRKEHDDGQNGNQVSEQGERAIKILL
ncbi:hypothetical protein HAX54_038057 [Datura stramonium]|uniref:Uncharacterized protein n=1 Tax=Datura stramonium TaxID=4076 RepID=A0ABS8VJ97_DATST|nr:hypothetical protein [Datura stramonium]